MEESPRGAGVERSGSLEKNQNVKFLWGFSF